MFRNNGVHSFISADNGVHRTNIYAKRAADTAALIDNSSYPRRVGPIFRIKRLHRTTQELCQLVNGGHPAGRTLIDLRLSVCNSLRIIDTARVAAARALGLRQARIDPIDQFRGHRYNYLTRIPGFAPSSGVNTKRSFPPGPAASTIPSETPKRILRGARFATMTVMRPFNCSG